MTHPAPANRSIVNLHFDCLSGISGDMTLGALIDLGADSDMIQRGLRSLNLPNLGLRAEQVKKCGFRAVQITIDHPVEKAHRHLHHIDAMIDGAADITDAAKRLAKRIFLCVGEAEAKVHGCTLRQVHFHEVGAIDSIADIVGVAIAIDLLGATHFTASPVPTGHGCITIDHGRVSIPAPATAEILIGVPIAPCAIESELTTPTGAAIIKTLACSFGPAPAMTPRAVGYGAGTRDLPGQANVLRVTLGDLLVDADSFAGLESDRVALLEANIDDADPETLAEVTATLMQSGALDVWQTPCVMKKGRLATILSALAPPSLTARLQTVMLTQTTTIGVRRQTLDRAKLPRRLLRVELPFGSAMGKVSQFPNGQFRFKLEQDEVRRLVQTTGLDAHTIRAAAQQAATEAIAAAGPTLFSTPRLPQPSSESHG